MAYFYKWVSNKQKLKLTPIDNKLKREKNEFKVKTVVELTDELNDPSNSGWHQNIAHYATNDIYFELNNRAEHAQVELRWLLSDEDIQRLLDGGHCANISAPSVFDARRLNPIFAVKLPNEDYFHVTDGQHTLAVIAGLARAGRLMLDGKIIAPEDWLSVKVDVMYVKSDSLSFARKHFLYINGKGKKPIDDYDTHAVNTLCVRLDSDTDPEAIKAEELQSIAEDCEITPLPKNHSQAEEPNAVTHISGMNQLTADAWKFLCENHQTYWSSEKVDNAEFGLFAGLYEHCTKPKAGIRTDTKQFAEFIRDFNATVKQVFVNPNGLKEAVTEAYKKYSLQVLKTEKSPDKTVALAVVLKIYKKAGGTHIIPGIANSHAQDGYDVIDFLSDEIKAKLP
jgi:hypothetical protein